MKPVSTKKKLLVATIGLATLNLVGCGYGTSGNLVAPPSCEEQGTCDASTPDAGTTEDAGAGDNG